MKKFLVKILVFIVPIIAILYPVDLFLSNYLKKSNTHAFGEYSVWNDLIEGNINSEIVIYGSSRAWVGINPNLIGKELNKKVYNLGIDGHNFWLQYLRHQILLKYNKKPRHIIVSIDPFTFERREDLYNKDQFLPYLLYNNNFHQSLKPYKGYSTTYYYIPCLRFIGRTKAVNAAFGSLIKPNTNEAGRVNGFKAINTKWNKDLEKAIQKIKFYKIDFHKPTIRLFKRFIKECKEENIKLIFIYTPEHMLGQEFIKEKKLLMNLMNEITSKNNIPFIDYSKDSICSDKKYFYNSNHLNKLGSEKFTIKLIEDLKPIVQ